MMILQFKENILSSILKNLEWQETVNQINLKIEGIHNGRNSYQHQNMLKTKD